MKHFCRNPRRLWAYFVFLTNYFGSYLIRPDVTAKSSYQFPLHFHYLLPSKSSLLLSGGKTRLHRVKAAPIKNNFLVFCRSFSHLQLIWLDAIQKREAVRVYKLPPSPPCDMEALRPVDRSGWEGTNRQQDCGGEKETKSLRTRSHQLGREVGTCLNGGVRASVRNKRVVSPPPLHRKTDWDWETEPTLECWARKKTHLREFGICETNLETPDRGSTRAMPFPKSFCKDLFRRFITTTYGHWRTVTRRNPWRSCQRYS